MASFILLTANSELLKQDWLLYSGPKLSSCFFSSLEAHLGMSVSKLAVDLTYKWHCLIESERRGPFRLRPARSNMSYRLVEPECLHPGAKERFTTWRTSLTGAETEGNPAHLRCPGATRPICRSHESWSRSDPTQLLRDLQYNDPVVLRC